MEHSGGIIYKRTWIWEIIPQRQCGWEMCYLRRLAARMPDMREISVY